MGNAQDTPFGRGIGGCRSAIMKDASRFVPFQETGDAKD
jgi:hypothetical protein